MSACMFASYLGAIKPARAPAISRSRTPHARGRKRAHARALEPVREEGPPRIGFRGYTGVKPTGFVPKSVANLFRYLINNPASYQQLKKKYSLFSNLFRGAWGGWR